MRVDLKVDAAERLDALSYKYAAFLDPQGQARGTVHLVRSTQSEFRPVQRGNWEILAPRAGAHLAFESYFEKGDFDFQTRLGTLRLTSRGDPENYLRVLFAHLALDEGGLILHACGIIRGGRGYCFFGPSTYGKTTIAKLSAGETILSDDLALIKKEKGRYFIFGVPFRGDLPEAPRTNASAPLAGLYSLVKSDSHRLEKLSVPRALGELLSVVPFVMRDAASRAQVVERLMDLMASLPPYALHFRRDPGFWQVLEQNG
jgi:hypothetical protein